MYVSKIPRQGLEMACFGDKSRVVLDTLFDMGCWGCLGVQPHGLNPGRDELVQMMGEGVAKKEMARRTGLSVPTVRKYLKMIEQ